MAQVLCLNTQENPVISNVRSASDTHETIQPDWQLRPSQYLETLDIGDGEYVVWNRFHPVPTLLNESAMAVLHGSVDGLSAEELAHCRTLFLAKKLAYEGDGDPSEAAFLDKINSFTGQLRERDDRNSTYYKTLEFSNDPCNVGCSYCMIPVFNEGAKDLVTLGKKAPPKRSGMTREAKLEAFKKILDQFIQARLEAGATAMPISLSGGEMLAQWPLVKAVIEYVAERYPEAQVTWTINSSLTILTKEQAEFFHVHNVKVHTSIDGYKENHDKYRTYHNGKGTFDDVLRGVALYNEHNPDHPITGFQGTIAEADEFDANRMFEFVTSQFEAARMAPNLLGVSEEEGEKQADLMMDLQIAGEKLGFAFGDTIFAHMKGHIKANGEAPFSLYCAAMSNQEDQFHVNVNISTMHATRSCSFVPGANVSLDEIDYDIYHSALWKQNVAFAEERAETIKKNCLSCEIAGMCHGSCVLSGIDANNQMNHGGCAYLRRLWRRIMVYLLNREGRLPSRTAKRLQFDEVATEAAAAGDISAA